MRISHLFHTLDFWRAHLAVNREPAWENVLPLFFFHRDGVLAIQRLARDWTRLYGLRKIDVFQGNIIREKWSGLPPWGDPVGMLVHAWPAGHRWR